MTMAGASFGHKEFISEPIVPVEGSFESSSMAAGEPGLPLRFVWRGSEYAVVRVCATWKTTGACSHGSREQYVRKHWFRVEVTGGVQMEIYFDRQARSRDGKKRWWLASIVPETSEDRYNEV
jgi:hypothetical protein